MTRYALTEGLNGAIITYPYSYAEFIAAHPMVSFPREVDDAWLAKYNIYTVETTAQPAYDITKNIVEGEPVWLNGQLQQVWQEVDASAEQLAARQKAVADKTAKTEVQADTFVKQFIGMTPAEINSYITANVTDLASARTVLNKLALIVQILARKEFS